MVHDNSRSGYMVLFVKIFTAHILAPRIFLGGTLYCDTENSSHPDLWLPFIAAFEESPGGLHPALASVQTEQGYLRQVYPG